MDMLAEVEEVEAEVSSRSEAATGFLRVNAPFTFGILRTALP